MSKHRFFPLFLLAVSPLLVAGCSTAINGSLQPVSFTTVGADDAYCIVEIGENSYKYSVRPPQKLNIQRSKDPMSISCTAPGNRTQKMVVESNIAGATYLNGASAGLTLPWDAATGAMYQYPDMVIVDFTSISSKEKPLPSYHNKGALDTKAQGIEYFGPDTPALETDKADAERYKAAYEEAARLESQEAANAAEKERRINAVEGGFYGDKDGKKFAPAVPKETAGGTSKKAESAVTIAPLSESLPPTPSAPEQAVPQTNPKLGKSIFPNSTSF